MPLADANFSNSRYNFVVLIEEGCLLYNSFSGAVLLLNGPDSAAVCELLASRPRAVDTETFPDNLLADLFAGNFLVPASFDELQAVRDRFREARRETPLALTLTTTLDCNLGCYYCYEDRSDVRLDAASAADVISWVRFRLLASRKKTLHVDWYGGEPLLNYEFIETASPLLQQLCHELEVVYSASIISNGTCWPDEVGAFIQRHKIRQTQISFDGMRHHHDLRRRFRNKSEQASSFDLAVALVDGLLEFVRVDVRINIDRKNEGDVLPFVEFAQSRGWFQRKFPAVIQPARLSAYSETSAFMRKSELTVAEYDQLRTDVRAKARGNFKVEESEAPEGFPVPRSSVCAALANDSVVVGADQRLYRCGLQVSEPHRAVGLLNRESAGPFRIIGSKTLAKYPDFRIVLVLMKPGSEMKEHHADARISIQTIQGRIRLHLPDQAVEVGSGELMCLESGIAHDVKAIEESAFLITVSWPGGSAEERHAMS